MIFLLWLIILILVYQINVSIIVLRLKLLSYQQLLLTFLLRLISGQKPGNILFGHIYLKLSFIVTSEGSFAELFVLILVFELIYVLNEKKNKVLIVIREMLIYKCDRMCQEIQLGFNLDIRFSVTQSCMSH